MKEMIGENQGTVNIQLIIKVIKSIIKTLNFVPLGVKNNGHLNCRQTGKRELYKHRINEAVTHKNQPEFIIKSSNEKSKITG
jgi:hypothetical protein